MQKIDEEEDEESESPIKKQLKEKEAIRRRKTFKRTGGTYEKKSIPSEINLPSSTSNIETPTPLPQLEKDDS